MKGGEQLGLAARYLVLSASNRLINGDWSRGVWQNTGAGGTTHGGEEYATPPGDVAERIDALASVPWPRRGGAAGRCPLFVELCCGSAAVTLRLLGGRRARPPVSYMGSKAGYASTILHVLGLRSGQGADAVLLNDPGPWSKVWRVLTDPVGARRVAEIIRGWADEDPRALWERLRAEAVPEDEAEGSARWAYLQSKNFSGQDVASNGRVWQTAAYKSNTPATYRMVKQRSLPPDVKRAIGDYIRERREAAGLTRRQVDDACGVVTACSWWEGRPRGTQPPGWPTYERLKPILGLDGRFDDVLSTFHRRPVTIENPGSWETKVPDAVDIAPRFDALSRLAFPQTTVLSLSAADIGPIPRLPAGTVVYIDPPYQGDGSRPITGYAHSFSREAVVEVALRWKAAGALVAVSESVAIPELVKAGWHVVDIAAERRGQKSTFSAEKGEFLTLSAEPAWRPASQIGLFFAPTEGTR